MIFCFLYEILAVLYLLSDLDLVYRLYQFSQTKDFDLIQTQPQNKSSNQKKHRTNIQKQKLKLKSQHETRTKRSLKIIKARFLFKVKVLEQFRIQSSSRPIILTKVKDRKPIILPKSLAHTQRVCHCSSHVYYCVLSIKV